MMDHFEAERRVLSYLHHQATDLQSPTACEAFADILASGDLSALTGFALPFHPDVLHLIPLLSDEFEELPNVPLAISFYKKASDLGKQGAAKKAAILISEYESAKPPSSSSQDQESEEEEESKAYLQMKIAVQENDVQAIKTLASWKWADAEGESTSKKRKVVKDKKKSRRDAFKLWLKAAQLGDTSSMRTVASFYVAEMGDGKGSMIRALNWLEKAAKMDDSSSVAKVAAIYRQKLLDGPLGQKDIAQVPADNDEFDEEDIGPLTWDDIVNKALEWTEKAATIGDVSSLFALAEAHSNRSSNWDPWALPFDTKLGIKYFLQAFDAGNVTALIAVISTLYELWGEEQHRLAKKYRRERNEKEAKEKEKKQKDGNLPSSSPAQPPSEPTAKITFKPLVQKSTFKFRPKDIQDFADGFDLATRHVYEIFKQIQEITSRNNVKKFRARCSGMPQDVIKLFIKIEDDLGVTHSLDSSSGSSSDEEDSSSEL